MSGDRRYRVPGRINFIGEHTDYNLGFVFPGAVDLGLDFHVSLLDQEEHIFYSSHFQEEDVCQLDGSGLTKTWSIFFKQTLRLIAEKGYKIGGIRCSFDGDLPVGAGMSSSSALTCGLIYVLNDCFDLGFSKLDIVNLASEAERGSGLDGGKMDQYAITFGEEDALLLLDCKTLKHESIDADFGDYELVLIDTKVTHSLVDSGYNDRHDDCKRGLKVIKEAHPEVTSVRDITHVMLAQSQESLDPISYQRLSYVLEENDRVGQVKRALNQDDLLTVGQLLYASHAGLSKKYEVSCDELDFIVDRTQEVDKVLGARMMGGGFGGCVIALIEAAAVTSFFAQLKQEYKGTFGHEPALYPVRLSDGIRRV